MSNSFSRQKNVKILDVSKFLTFSMVHVASPAKVQYADIASVLYVVHTNQNKELET